VKFALKSKIVTIEWTIEGYTGFFVGNDKKMYKIATRREIKMVLNGYSKGYYLNRKFYTPFG
jgi:hypothetical protein